MTPMNRDLAAKFHASMLPLTEPLHEAFGLARKDCPKYMPKYRHAGRMSHLRSGIIRAGVREHLHDAMPAEWKLTGNPELMGQVKLENQADGIAIRVLKGKKPRMGVPHAGTNRSRRAFWLNTPMLSVPLPMTVQEQHNLLLLWMEDGDDFHLRLVRPTSPGTYFKRVDVDFTMDLAPIRSDFESLEFFGEFPGSGVEEDLFNPQIDEEGEEDAH